MSPLLNFKLFSLFIIFLYIIYIYTHILTDMHMHVYTHLLSPFGVGACMCMCLGLITWSEITKQWAHPWRKPILPLSIAGDCCTSSVRVGPYESPPTGNWGAVQCDHHHAGPV